MANRAGGRRAVRQLWLRAFCLVLGTAAGPGLLAAQGTPAGVPLDSGEVGDRVVVAARRLARGTVLVASDFAAAPAAPLAAAPGGLIRDSRRVPSPGWVTRRVVLAGEPLREPAVAPAPLVAAGQAVRYELTQDGIRLSLDGVAASGASLGGRVTVRLGANRRVTGVVAGPGRVSAVDTSRTS